MSDGRKAAEEDAEDLDRLCRHFGLSSEEVWKDRKLERLLETMHAKERELHEQHLKHLRTRREALLKLTEDEIEVLGL